MFEYALAAGLTASGADAYLLHVTTTPSVSYVVRTENFDCGIMISASHNPFYDNGIKIINSAGHKMEAEVEEKIEAYIDGETGDLPLAVKENIGRTVDYSAGRNRYIGHLISIATRSFKDMRVGLDCANGRSLDTQRTTVFSSEAASWLNLLTEAAQTGVSRLGNILRTTLLPISSGGCTVVRSPLTPPNLGAVSPTAGSSPQSCTGVPLNVTVAMIDSV